MQTLNRRTNLHPLIPTILPVQLLATIVQLSPSILLDWSSKISNNLGSLVSNPTSLHKSTRSRICFTTNRTERYRPSVQLLNDWSHTQSSIVATWWKMMILWRITLWSQFFTQIVSKVFYPKHFLLSQWFSLDFSVVFSYCDCFITYKGTHTLLFKEKIEWANLGIIFSRCIDTNDCLYRYKALDQRSNLKILTFVSIQTRDVSIQTSESWNLDWYVSKHASMLRIIWSLLVFQNIYTCIDTCKHVSNHMEHSVFV
jgi:hypothetical protein